MFDFREGDEDLEFVETERLTHPPRIRCAARNDRPRR
jgi:hypothetical protein